MTETCDVAYQVLGIATAKPGAMWLVDVALEVNGLELNIRGIVVRRIGHELDVKPPCSRRPGGEWVPAVDLPAELLLAVAGEVRRVMSPLLG